MLAGLRSSLGLILANLAFVLASLTSTEAFLSWGWRVPFWASAVLIALGLGIRLKVAESPEFQALKSANEVRKTPLVDVFREHRKPVLLTALAYLGAGVFFYMAAVFALSYGQVHLGVDRNVLLTLVLLGFAFTAVGMPFFGWLSDRYDRRRIFLLGAVFMTITPFAWLAPRTRQRRAPSPVWSVTGRAVTCAWAPVVLRRRRPCGIAPVEVDAGVAGAGLLHSEIWPVAADEDDPADLSVAAGALTAGRADSRVRIQNF